MQKGAISQIIGEIPTAIRVAPGPEHRAANRREPLLSVQEIVNWIVRLGEPYLEIANSVLASQFLPTLPEQYASYRIATGNRVKQR
jgi:hypothetical protein